MAESETMSIDTSTNDAQEDPLQDLPDDQLYKLLEEALHANEILRAENEMFKNFYDRDAHQVVGASTALKPVSSMQQDIMSRVSRKRSKSRSSASERSLKLSAEQKCEIAQREIEEQRTEIDLIRDKSEKIIDTYVAVIEEADVRLNEMKKAEYEFHRDILKNGVNTRTGRVMSEKVVRYFEDKMRARDTLIEKLRLKNATLKVQRKKMRLQLKQKEEMGEVLHKVDFEQLKIENNQYLEKIDEKNQELLRLKLMAGNTLQVLNNYKKKLNFMTGEAERLKSEIQQRSELMRRIDSESTLVEEERKKAEGINRRLRQQLSDYKVPEVMEYVSSVANLYELRKKEKIWDRKVDIAKMALDRHRRVWQQIRRGSYSAAI